MNQNNDNDNNSTKKIGQVLVKKKPNFDDYLLYSHGGAFNLITMTWLGEGSKSSPYIMVRMRDNQGNHHLFHLHRLIYETFIGEIPEGMQINHINEDKKDNAILFNDEGDIVYCNLELVTPKENCNHGNRNQKISATLKGKTKTKQSFEVKINGGEPFIIHSINELMNTVPNQNRVTWNYRLYRMKKPKRTYIECVGDNLYEITPINEEYIKRVQKGESK